MPIRPRPFTFEYKQCGWTKTLAPPSDALGPGDWFERCPRCGNEHLALRQPSFLERLVVEAISRKRGF